jgi:hypothetical protein
VVRKAVEKGVFEAGFSARIGQKGWVFPGFFAFSALRVIFCKAFSTAQPRISHPDTTTKWMAAADDRQKSCYLIEINRATDMVILTTGSDDAQIAELIGKETGPTINIVGGRGVPGGVV